MSVLDPGGKHSQVICKTVQKGEGLIRIFTSDLFHTFKFPFLACTTCISPLYNL